MDTLVDATPNFDLHHFQQQHHQHTSVSSMSGMPMYFHWSTDVVVLFEAWHVNTPGWYMVTAATLFLLGLFYEWLITFRQGYEYKIQSKRFESKPIAADFISKNNRHNLLRHLPEPQVEAVNKNAYHLVAAALHVLQLSIAYVLMLVVMTYNLGLVIAVIGGAGVGYFLFARLRRNMSINEAGYH